MAKFTVQLPRFDGGLNTKVSPSLGDPDQSPNLQDVTFDDFGAVATRYGYTPFTSQMIEASAPIDGLHSYVKNDGTSQLMAAHNGSIWRASGNTFVTIPSAYNTFTTETKCNFVTFQDRAFISNGLENPAKWNGTEFTRWGVSVPSAATVEVSSAGAGDGYYRYVILGVSSDGARGDYGSETTEVSLVSQRAYLTEIPVFPTSEGVNTKLICRNTAAASGVYYVLTEIANATTVYEDNCYDCELLTEAPLDHGLPQKFTVHIAHLGYMFGAAGNSTDSSFLYYSNINDPQIFGSEDLIRIGEGDGFKISGLIEFAGSLLITKTDSNGGGSVYLLFTPDSNPLNWSLSRLDTAYGNEARSTLVKFSNFVLYLNRNGVFDLNEQAVGSIKSDSLSFNIESEILNIAKSYIDKACAITFKNKVWISVPYGTTQPTNNRIYQYDFVRGRNLEQRELGAWSKFTNLEIGNFAIHAGNLYGGDSSGDTGMVYQLDTGTNDDSNAIDSYYQTMAIRGLPEHENYTKCWRHAYILVDASGDWDLEVTYINDFANESGTTANVSLDPGDTSEWDTFIWGVDPWGSGTLRKTVKIDFLNSVSKVIQLKFRTATADQYFKVYDVKLEYNLLGRR